ncbi:hypothetical protein L6164_033286 [Bauhinia variegata]|uniref:Uncharacterized protein n=1 Tax=Bauhinia variegata TaxID=167791 RepID=A0ACB9KRI0_BAUVA|nr:hypothetical protein L6164_033286 [Bauhinia variegata]
MTPLLPLALSLALILPLAAVAVPPPSPLTNHGGPLLGDNGNLDVSILWYGPIAKVQKRSILNFLKSLNANAGPVQPQVSQWWDIVGSYTRSPKINVKVVNQAFDPNYSLGKVLIKDFIKILLPKATGGKPNTLVIIVAVKGVTVQNMCAGDCAQHDFIGDQAYVAVGNPEAECPQCTAPFVPTGALALVKPPSGNIAADTMVRLLAKGLAGAVSNPLKTGFYAIGHDEEILDASSVCDDIGKFEINSLNGGAFNAHGFKGKKFLLPAIWNPKTSSCWTPL